ncbi:GNAT family N-acetyltransferase [Legionella gresilensis]|uniref:GNAT family N-acetyltransferase n=1 Tax=Legionella gresilensis TaxID=91823 RepID=UPI001040E762|nr:GNAT family N-acetyltransferase [Legionella gresilensis]
MTIILETKRLVLKTMALKDLDSLFALRSDPLVMKYIGSGNLQTKEQVKELINLDQNYFKEFGLGFFNVFNKSDGDFIGQAGLFHLGFDVNQPEIEIAYRLFPEYWLKGYATELAIALIKWGFREKKLDRIIAMVHPENEQSRRVLEKSGMSYVEMISFRNNRLHCKNKLLNYT